MGPENFLLQEFQITLQPRGGSSGLGRGNPSANGVPLLRAEARVQRGVPRAVSSLHVSGRSYLGGTRDLSAGTRRLPDLPAPIPCPAGPTPGGRRKAGSRARRGPRWTPRAPRARPAKVCRSHRPWGLGGSGSPKVALRTLLRPRGWCGGQPRSPNHAPFLEKEAAESGWLRSRGPALFSPTFPYWRPTGPATPCAGSPLLSCLPPNFYNYNGSGIPRSLCFLLISAILYENPSQQSV